MSGEAMDRNRPITLSEHFAQFQQRRDYMIGEALEAIRRASISYRNFLVGVCVFAFKEDAPPGEQYRIFPGANVKVLEGWDKQCAEIQACQQARIHGYTLIIGLVIVGKPQRDDRSGVEPMTLHPCALCREYFQQIPEVVGETEFYSTNPSQEISEAFTLKELFEKHSAGRFLAG